MIYFLYGSDGYRIRAEVNKIISNLKDYNLLSFDLSDKDELRNFEESIKTQSFFDEKTLYNLKNGFSVSKKLKDLIEEWDLLKDKERAVLISEEQTPVALKKTDKELFGLLSKSPSQGKELIPLEGRQLETWIKEEFEKAGLEISPLVASKIINVINLSNSNVKQANDISWRLHMEIEKIVSFAAGAGIKKIIENEVETLIPISISASIFEAIDAIGQRQKGRAITLIQKNLDAGADPYYIFSMIVYQYRNLLRVKELLGSSSGASKTGLHPYVFQKTSSQAKNFEFSELKNKFSQLAKGDIDIKNGIIDPVDYIFQFVLN